MLTTTETSDQLNRLGLAIRAYKVASGRTLGFAIIKAGRNLAFSLYAETRKISPSKQKLLELGPALGWRVKRKQGGALAELRRRVNSRFFHALGWLPAKKGFSKTNTVTSVRNKYGALYAVVEQTGTAHLQLVNFTGHIEKVTGRHGIMQRAVNDVLADMRPYIKTKLGQDAAIAFDLI